MGSHLISLSLYCWEIVLIAWRVRNERLDQSWCWSCFVCSLCIFCGERDASFTEDGLDLHYWKHCPMLQRCLQCRQVHTHSIISYWLNYSHCSECVNVVCFLGSGDCEPDRTLADRVWAEGRFHPVSSLLRSPSPT